MTVEEKETEREKEKELTLDPTTTSSTQHQNEILFKTLETSPYFLVKRNGKNTKLILNQAKLLSPLEGHPSFISDLQSWFNSFLYTDLSYETIRDEIATMDGFPRSVLSPIVFKMLIESDLDLHKLIKKILNVLLPPICASTFPHPDALYKEIERIILLNACKVEYGIAPEHEIGIWELNTEITQDLFKSRALSLYLNQRREFRTVAKRFLSNSTQTKCDQSQCTDLMVYENTPSVTSLIDIATTLDSPSTLKKKFKSNSPAESGAKANPSQRKLSSFFKVLPKEDNHQTSLNGAGGASKSLFEELFKPFFVKPGVSLGVYFQTNRFGHFRKDDFVINSDISCSSNELFEPFSPSNYFSSGSDCSFFNSTYQKNSSSATAKKHFSVILIEDENAEFSRRAQCVKLLKFCENYRPPYFGLLNKKFVNISRRPFCKLDSYFDYEIDSDEEWEEDEEGESCCSSDEDENNEEDLLADDDEEEDWVVPHGYLSEDEGENVESGEKSREFMRKSLTEIKVAIFYENSSELLKYCYKSVVAVASNGEPVVVEDDYGKSIIDPFQEPPSVRPSANAHKEKHKKKSPIDEDEHLQEVFRKVVHGSSEKSQKLYELFIEESKATTVSKRQFTLKLSQVATRIKGKPKSIWQINN